MRVSSIIAGAVVATLLALGSGPQPAHAQLMIVGNDQKVVFTDGKPAIAAQGKDTLSVVDISQPAKPRISATIPLDNSIAGPPTNLAITPSRDIALVASSMKSEAKDGKFALVPDNRLFVVDLQSNPPAVTATLPLGKSPSGLAIARDGRWALVCNRGDGTISLLSIEGKTVKVADMITVGAPADAVSAVAIAPDGKRALAVKSASNKIAVLHIESGKVTYSNKEDLPGNNYPYNVGIVPDGSIALIANTGNGGSSDGSADTVSVIDMAANPIRVIDHITVGDSPEGLAISPKGNLAVTVEARGANKPKDTWYYHPDSAVTLLKIAGKKVTRIGEVPVGVFAEGAAFSADGSRIYVGNFIGADISVLAVAGSKVTDTRQKIKLPGQPASMRSGPQ